MTRDDFYSAAPSSTRSCSLQVLIPQCIGHPTWCSGGHRFNSCRELRLFLCSTLVSCWSIHLSHFITKLKIHHLYSSLITFTMTPTVLILVVWTQHMNSVKRPCSPWILVAQWIERPSSFREVMGSISLGGSDIFCLSYAHVMLINSPFTILTCLCITLSSIM